MQKKYIRNPIHLYMPKENDNPMTTTKKGILVLSSACTVQVNCWTRGNHSWNHRECHRQVLLLEHAHVHWTQRGYKWTHDYEPGVVHDEEQQKKKTNRKSNKSLRARMGQTPHGSSGRMAPKDWNPRKQSMSAECRSRTLHLSDTLVARSIGVYRPRWYRQTADVDGRTGSSLVHETRGCGTCRPSWLWNI